RGAPDHAGRGLQWNQHRLSREYRPAPGRAGRGRLSAARCVAAGGHASRRRTLTPPRLAAEQPAQIDEELQERRKIGERKEQYQYERGADHIDVERQPLARPLVADGTVNVKAAQPCAAMGTESRRGHRPGADIRRLAALAVAAARAEVAALLADQRGLA